VFKLLLTVERPAGASAPGRPCPVQPELAVFLAKQSVKISGSA